MCAFPFDETELTEEEVDEIIRKIAERIQQYGMETAAILTLESVKPIVYIGGEMSRLMISPFLPALGPNANELGENLINVFEERKNVEKLITILEEMASGEYGKEEDEQEAGAPEEGQEKPEADEASDEQAEQKKRKSWRDWLPF
ncbi:hypothetical protein KAV47_04910 [Candidatus Bathyarchaeota archaeon]|jgi:hypothetical protein|nr:hypothetical protein [Candidatus Bathyarchaeota archaeon]